MSKVSKKIKYEADVAYDAAVDSYNTFDWCLPLVEIKKNLKEIQSNFESAAEKYGEIEQWLSQHQTYELTAEGTESTADYAFDLAEASNDAYIKKTYFDIALVHYDLAIKYHTHLNTSIKKINELRESRLYVLEKLTSGAAINSTAQIIATTKISAPNKSNKEAIKAVEVVKARDVRNAIVICRTNENSTNMHVEESQIAEKNIDKAAMLIEADRQTQSDDVSRILLFNILKKSLTITHKHNVARLARQIAEVFNTDDYMINPLEDIINLPQSTNLFSQKVSKLQKIKNLFEKMAKDLDAKLNLEESDTIALYNMEKKLGADYLELMATQLSKIIESYFGNNTNLVIQHISQSLITLNHTTRFKTFKMDCD